MPAIAATLAGIVLAAAAASAENRYTPPEGCEPLATLQLPNCLVRQVARCPDGNVQDSFHEGVFTGRAYYAHPALFVRYEGVDGYVSGHRYGDGAPERDAALAPGMTYTYSREVFRNLGTEGPGDTGTEVMEVGERMAIELDGRRLQVLDIRFTVTNEKTGYHYRERAFVMEEPALTIGALASTTRPDGEKSNTSTIPEAILLPGDQGFLSNDPPVSCLPGA